MKYWHKITIGDLGKIVTGKTPKTKNTEFWNGGIPFVTPADLQKSKHIFSTERTVSHIGLNSVKGATLPTGAICVSCIGNLGYTAMTTHTSVSNQQINSIIPSVEFDKNFVYYLMKSLWDEFKNLEGQSTTLSILNKTLFSKIEVSVPDLEKTQQQIAKVLSSLDDKIELNTQINHNLLKEALTLYAAHFASQDKNGCIGDYCSVRSGFAFKSSWWVDKGVKVIKIGSISQDNLNLLECSHVDEDKIEKASDFKVGAGDLLIAMTGATIGKFTMVPHCSETLLVNQRVGKFFLGNNPVEKLPFIYCTLKQPDIYNEIVNRGQGSAQPNISAVDIMNIPCVIPSIDNLTTFNNTCQPLFDLIISNQRESQQLSEIRDSLLPKLMSGEIDVSEVEV